MHDNDTIKASFWVSLNNIDIIKRIFKRIWGIYEYIVPLVPNAFLFKIIERIKAGQYGAGNRPANGRVTKYLHQSYTAAFILWR
jgi:hypothetical protein